MRVLGSGVVRVLLARTIALAVAFVFSMATVRIVLGAHGLESYASIALVGTLVSALPFADLGLGVALSNIASEHLRGLHSDRLKPALLAVASTLVAIGLTIAGALIASLALVPSAFDVPVLTRIGNPVVYLSLLAALFVLWLVGGIANRLLMGLGRPATLMLLGAVAPVLVFICTWIAISMDAPAWVLALMPIAAAATVSLVGGLICRRIIRAHGPLAGRPLVGGLYRELMKQGAAGLALGVGVALLLQSDRLVVANRGSVEDLAHIALVLPPFAAVQSLLGAAGAYLWPHYYGLLLEGRLNQDYLRKQLRGAVLCGTGLGVVFVGLMPVYLRFVGYEGSSLSALSGAFGALVICQAATLVPSSFLTSPSLIRRQGIIALTTGVAKVSLAGALVPWMGAPGAVLASVLAVGAFQFPTYWRSAMLANFEPSKPEASGQLG